MKKKFLKLELLTLEEAQEKIDIENNKLEGKIKDYLKDSGVSKIHVIRKSNIPRATFLYKLRNKSFTGPELITISKIIS